jgi:ubiquinone/menaquinone biosynthesis C-methylase UbiE
MSTNSITVGYEKEWNISYGLDKDPVRMKLIYPWLDRNIGDLSGKIILDAGCGNGTLASHLKDRKFKSLVGMDKSEIFLDFAKTHVNDRRISFQNGDLLSKWDFKEKSFDIIFSVFVINELSDLNFFFKQAARVLKDDGCMIVFMTHPFVHMYHYLKEKFTGEKNTKFPGLSGYFHKDKLTYHFTLSEALAEFYPYTFQDVVSSISLAGLNIGQLYELTTDTQDFVTIPEYKETSNVPKFLGLNLKKSCN